MLRCLFFVLIFTSFLSNAQDSLYVKLSPNSDYNQLMLYKVRGAQQSYISNAKRINDTFKFGFPLESEQGMFRLYYDIQNRGFIEIIYNEESVSVEFDPTNPNDTTNFIRSKENRIFEKYNQLVNVQQSKIDSLQLVFFELEEKDSTDILYADAVYKLKGLQHSFEELSKGLLTHHFIRSNMTYNSDTIIETPTAYFKAVKTHFFDAVDFSDVALQNSSFYMDKVVEYVFYLNDSDDPEIYVAIKKEAINDVMLKVGGNYKIKSELLSSLLFAFADQQDIELVDFIKTVHYEALPSAYKNIRLIQQIDGMLKVAIGTTAPEITWQSKGRVERLSELKRSDYYIVTFWSTSCSHCLHDIPKLYQFTEDFQNVKVIAVALEENSIEFDKITKEMSNWINVLGLNKWENEFARSYDINSTPSFFVLGSDKKIIAKPEDLKDLKSYFE